MKKILTTVGNVAANIVTLGGHQRIKSAHIKYNEAYSEYESKYKKYTQLDLDQDSIIKKIGSETKKGFAVIDDVEIILRRLVATNGIPPTPSSSSNSTLQQIHGLNASLNSAMEITKGSAASSLMAVGSWSLVSMLGTASTGSAIGGLSGAAATNATLAWFGGGSLAAGGAGMAGGAMALTGIAALPLIAYSSWKTHDNANEVKSETQKIVDEIQAVTQNINDIKSQIHLAKQKLQALEAAVQRLSKVHIKVVNILFPLRKISRSIRWLRSLFGGKYYKSNEVRYVLVLEREVTIFIRFLNSSS